MPAEMSAERKAIVDDLKDHATRLGNNGFHNAKDVLFAYAKDLEDNIPPAPAERWPRCGCGCELTSFHGHGRFVITCQRCSFQVTHNSADEALREAQKMRAALAAGGGDSNAQP